MRKLLLLTFCLGVFAQHPDRIIADAISREIQNQNLGSVNVSSYMGEVTLSGYVNSDEDRRLVEKIALSVDGVKRVKSQLRVQPVARAKVVSCQRPNISGILEGPASITLSCNSDSIIISGNVEYPWDEKTLIKAVQEANPGMRVASEVVVRKLLDDEKIKNLVETALRENNHSLEGITFDVRERVVYFKGNVSNHRVIDAILATALMVEGVKDAKSEVKIR